MAALWKESQKDRETVRRETNAAEVAHEARFARIQRCSARGRRGASTPHPLAINNIHIHKSPYSFDDMMDDVMEWPFDLNEFWERKMWLWLTENIQNLDGKILFWNIGGSYKKSLNLK